MPTAKKLKTRKICKKNWFQRRKPGVHRRGEAPWYTLPAFNDGHPLEVLKARLRYWEAMDKEYRTLRWDDKLLVEKSLRSISEDLRWLATRLDCMLDGKYYSVAD